MGQLVEKVAYLKGLAEGMQIEESTNEGKLISKMLDVLDELSSEFEKLSDEVCDTEMHLNEIDDMFDALSEEIDDVLDDMYDDADYEDDSYSYDDEDDDMDMFEDLDDDMDFYEVECPHCKEKVYFDEDMIESDNLVCPNCKEEIEIEFVDDEDESDSFEDDEE